MKALRGFTLPEVGIVMVILAIAVGIAIPSFTSWIERIQVRNLAESVLHGLQVARSEAIKRNTTVAFTLTGGTAWSIDVVSPATAIQSRPGPEGDPKAFLSIIQPATATPFTVSFNSLGRQVAPGAAVSLSLSNTADTECTAAGPFGCYVIEVSLGGLIKMCDPGKPAGTPQAC